MTVIFPRPSNDEEALTLALTLALTAPAGSEALGWLITTAEGYAADLDAATVETCKAAALERADRFLGFEYPDGQRAGAPTPQALDALAPSKTCARAALAWQRGDVDEAEWLYRRAAAEGDPFALAGLGCLIELHDGNEDEADRCFRSAARRIVFVGL